MKRTRTRKPKPATVLGTATLETWQRDPARILWAQTDPMFREAFTVITNARDKALAAQPGTTENYQLGVVRGYEIALDVVRSLAQGEAPNPPADPEPNYPKPDAGESVYDS